MENINEIAESVVVATESIPENTPPPLTPKEQLDALMARRTGEFDVKINHADLKYLRNTIHQKVEWKGPNESYLVIIALLTIDNMLVEIDKTSLDKAQLKFSASTVESINYFLSKITGIGLDSAQRLFTVSMVFRPAMEAIRMLDQEIELLKSELKS